MRRWRPVTAKMRASFFCFALACGACGRATPSAPPPPGAAAPGVRRDPADVAFAKELVGGSLGSLLDAFAKHPGINDRFQKLVGADRVTIRNCTGFKPSEKLGDTVVAQACRPEKCGGYQVIVAVDLAAGTLHCGLKTEDRMTVYSEDPQNLPLPLVEWRKDPISWTSHKP
jgi:hypothetical protein